jgi:hypothetical protein
MAAPSMAFTRLFPAVGRFRRTILIPLYQTEGESSGPFIYDGQNSNYTNYEEELNGQTASFSSWSRTLFPSIADGTYPNVEA